MLEGHWLSTCHVTLFTFANWCRTRDTSFQQSSLSRTSAAWCKIRPERRNKKKIMISLDNICICLWFWPPAWTFLGSLCHEEYFRTQSYQEIFHRPRSNTCIHIANCFIELRVESTHPNLFAVNTRKCHKSYTSEDVNLERYIWIAQKKNRSQK